MIVKIKYISFLFLVFIFVSGCSKYSNNPDLKLARDFIDAYYVFADQQKALGFTMGLAQNELQKELELLKDVPARQQAYRSRDVLFEMKKEVKSNDETIFLFELTLIIPEMEDQKRMINIIIDRQAGKVKYFGAVR